MNPFTILTPAEAWSGIAAIAALTGVISFIHWKNRPTKAEEQAYWLGFNDGADERPYEEFATLRLRQCYGEGYSDGSAGRNRRADAERLRKRASEPGSKRPATRH